MRKLVLIYSMLFLYMCFACSDNENLKPSGFDKDWFVIENDPNDPLKSLVYDIYVNMKVPVFYNDTIGKSVRGVDGNGNPVVHYQILVPHYTIDGMNTNYRFVISHDNDLILNTVRFLKERVLDKLPIEAMPKSYFLVDSVAYLVNEYYNEWESQNTYRGMMTTVCGRMSEIPDMSEEELQELASEMISWDLGPYLCKAYAKELEKFYLQTNAYAGKDLYGIILSYDSNPDYYADMNEYGFLRELSNYSSTPTKEEDVTDYAKYILIYSEEEFTDMYGDYDIIMAKYAIMKRIMADVQSKK